MPIKKDGTGKRWVEMEFVVPGTPEQVWQAMATGPATRRGSPRPRSKSGSAAVPLRFRPGRDLSGEVTTWEPPHRFGYVEATGAKEHRRLRPRSRSAAVGRQVRRAHSSLALHASDDWDNQMEGFESGWPGFSRSCGSISRILLACRPPRSWRWSAPKANSSRFWKHLHGGSPSRRRQRR